MNWIVRQFQFPTFAACFTWWRENLTLGGKTFTLAMLLCVPALPSLDSPAFLLFSVLLSLLLTAAVVNYWFRPKLALRIVNSPVIPCGEVVDLEVRVENRSSQPAFDVSLKLIDEPRSWQVLPSRKSIAYLPPGESVTLPITVRPMRRGVYSPPKVRATSTFPLNLVRLWHAHRVQGELVVLPPYHPLAALDASRMASRFVGERMNQHVALGHGGDYFGSREYLPGMPVRRWDYSSWARLGQPVVREFSEPHHPTVVVIVDTQVAPEGLGEDDVSEQLEATLSLAAALSEALTARHDHIMMLAVGDDVRDLSAAGIEHQHDAVLRRLAEAKAATDVDFSNARAQLRGMPQTPDAAFVLLNTWDRAREDLCDELLSLGMEATRLFIGPHAPGRARPLPGDVVASTEEIEAGCVEIQ